jgi:hypothetical protein
MTKLKRSLRFTLDGRTAYKHVVNEKPCVEGDIIYVLLCYNITFAIQRPIFLLNDRDLRHILGF